MHWLGQAQRAFELMVARANDRGKYDRDGQARLQISIVKFWAAQMLRQRPATRPRTTRPEQR
jgi:hypothetical protein